MGDALRSGYQIWLVNGVTALVLSAIEDGYIDELGYLRVVLLSGRHLIAEQMELVSRDLVNRGKTPIITLGDRSCVSACDVQIRYMEAVRKYLDHTEFTSDESEDEARKLVGEWETVVNAIYANNLDWLAGRLDWATKCAIFNGYVWRHANLAEHARIDVLRELDFRYHFLSVPGSGRETLFERISRFYKDRMPFSEREIEMAVTTPPSQTRAELRGDFVRMLLDREIPYNTVVIPWSHITWNNTFTYAMPDPLECDPERFKAFLMDISEYAARGWQTTILR